ncbi:MAG: amidophosphoribosyltransferase [Coriobacteriales bacterium]|nr:amidophosphoribosyltransferase [Coriobacteriales bacterium]
MAVHEECGVLGICSPQPIDAAQVIYHGLYALQHRGQESCGIVVNDDGVLVSHKDLGLVGEVFKAPVLHALPRGRMAVGHVRYGTTGATNRANCQPMEVNHQKGNLAIAHNGNLSNAAQLRDQLELGGAIFHSTSDTEIIAYVLTRERLIAPSIEEAANRAMNVLEGAYSLVLMSSQKLLCVRDPYGFRPLCIGQTRQGAYVVASETAALKAVGACYVRDVAPGEIVIFEVGDKPGAPAVTIRSITRHCGSQAPRHCVFEYIYFLHPDSVADGVGVQAARMRAGAILAQRYPVDADVVVGVPDSGIDAALGYSRHSGILYMPGLIKNKYIGRTFIAPQQADRMELVRIKLSAIEECVRGKRVVLVDDSIVRGTTSACIVRLLREAGAVQIHLRISAPPFRFPCFYGTDVDSQENLVACKHSVSEIARMLDVDSLGYLPLEDLPQMMGGKGYCSACFDGDYPTQVALESRKNRFEQRLSQRVREEEGAR